MLHSIASCFERRESGAIFMVGGIRAVFIFKESRQRVLRLPLPKDGTNLVLLDLVKFVLSRCSIAAIGSHLPLDKHGIEFIGMVPALSCDGQCSLGILARLPGFAR